MPHPFALFANGWARRCRDTTVFVASVENPAYDNPMAKAHKFDLENPALILDDEDEETLAAIDEASGTLPVASFLPGGCAGTGSQSP
jgi:hypothetical protein